MTTLVLLGALAAQAAPSAKVDIVSVTGCLKETTANNWTLTGATDPVPSSANAPAAKDIPKAPPQSIPQVIPIVRPPDDPGIDDEAPADEFSEQIGTPKAQAGGWRGFLSRWGS